jgi:hypothetical protein
MLKANVWRRGQTKDRVFLTGTVLQRNGQSSFGSRPGGPTPKSDENVEKVSNAPAEYASEQELNINRKTIWLILTKYSDLKKVYVKLVSKNSHLALCVKESETQKKSVVVAEHTVFSLDLAPCDSFLLTTKSSLKRSYCERVEGIQKVTTAVLSNFKKMASENASAVGENMEFVIQLQKEGRRQRNFRIKTDAVLPVS